MRLIAGANGANLDRKVAINAGRELAVPRCARLIQTPASRLRTLRCDCALRPHFDFVIESANLPIRSPGVREIFRRPPPKLVYVQLIIPGPGRIPEVPPTIDIQLHGRCAGVDDDLPLHRIIFDSVCPWRYSVPQSKLAILNALEAFALVVGGTRSSEGPHRNKQQPRRFTLGLSFYSGGNRGPTPGR